LAKQFKFAHNLQLTYTVGIMLLGVALFTKTVDTVPELPETVGYIVFHWIAQIPGKQSLPKNKVSSMRIYIVLASIFALAVLARGVASPIVQGLNEGGERPSRAQIGVSVLHLYGVLLTMYNANLGRQLISAWSPVKKTK